MSALGLKNVSPGVPSSQIPPWRIWNVEEASSVEQTAQEISHSRRVEGAESPRSLLGGLRMECQGRCVRLHILKVPQHCRKDRKVIHSLNSGMAWTSMPWCFIFSFNLHFFFYLVVAHRIFSCCMWTLTCGMWYLAPWPGIKPGPPALVVRSLSCWTTREVPMILSYISSFRNSIIMTTYKYDLIKKMQYSVSTWNKRTPQNVKNDKKWAFIHSEW